MQSAFGESKRIAVIGTGISGMAAAWLLSQRHDVTVYERAGRLGGHSNTIVAPVNTGSCPVDTGFIVYNEATYPNLTALFKHLGVPTRASDMSFAVSLDGGALEYAGNSLASLFAQKRNFIRPRFWSMLRDLVRFYRSAPRDLERLSGTEMTLGEYLDLGGFGSAFRDDHLLPMAGAIWSAPANALLDYPAAAFVRFCHNHGLLQVSDRPVWRTVVGGSRAYVDRLTAAYAHRVRLNAEVETIQRGPGEVVVCDREGGMVRYDHVVIATHADQALRMLDSPSEEERKLLGAFRYTRNHVVLHSDASLMPRRRAVWSSWNHVAHGRDEAGGGVSVTYWMNRLQNLDTATPLFVTLNPGTPPRHDSLLHQEVYEHPLFDAAAIAAQSELWLLQGRQNTWFCGAYFGAGFHEDGLQAGLAVAETLGGVRRPWCVPDESGRIIMASAPAAVSREDLAA